MKNKLRIAMTLLLATLLTGCEALKQDNLDLTEWWQDETGSYHHENTKDKSTLIYKSKYAKDYILPNGVGIAIPGEKDYDLYISPFSPYKYFRSKEPAGTKVYDPYTGKLLILGDRSQVKERDIPE